MRKVLALGLMLLIVLGAQFLISREKGSVQITQETVAGNPISRYSPAGTPAGVVLIAHGYASSKEMMRPWGLAMAAHGLEAYVIDQPGHGDNGARLPEGWSTDLGANLRAVVDQLVAEKRAVPGRIALLGHSMGGGAVTAAALQDPRVQATVALSSAHSEEIPADRPANLLSVVAERDPASMVNAVRAIATRSDNGKGEMGKRYGTYSQGTARQSLLVPDRNHITILYDEPTMRHAAQWVLASFGAPVVENVPVGQPWLWIGLALAGAIGVVLSVGAMLAPVNRRGGRSGEPRSSVIAGVVVMAVAAFSAVLAVVYVRTTWIGLAAGDYFLPYFLVMAAVLFALRLLWPRDFEFALGSDEPFTAGIIRGAAVFLGFLGAAGPVIHMNLANFMPIVPRILPMVLLAVAFFLFSVQEEGMKRAVSNDLGPWAGSLVGVIGKLLIIGTWMGATALPNPPRAIGLWTPVMLGLFLILEVIGFFLSSWRYSPRAVATFTALTLAWTAAVTFPLQ